MTPNLACKFIIMPGLPPEVVPAVSNLAGQGLNAISNIFTNRAQLRYNQKAYERQRADFLADREHNEQYNSPVNQMKLLRDAKLSPHLFYTKGAGFTASTSTSPATMRDWRPQAPQVDASSLIDTIMNFQIKTQQLDNMKAQKELLEEQIDLTKNRSWSETYRPKLMSAQQELMSQSARFRSELFSGQKELLHERINQMKQATSASKTSEQFQKDENARRELMKMPQFIMVLEKIAYLRKQGMSLEEAIQIQRQTRLMNEMELHLNRQGLKGADNVFLRLLSGNATDDVTGSTWIPELRNR